MSEFRRRLLMQSKSELPSAYQQVEYIESQGEQAITLDYIVQEDDEIYLEFKNVGYVNVDNYYFYSQDSYGLWFAINRRLINTTGALNYVRFGASASKSFPAELEGYLCLRKGQLEINGIIIDIDYYGMPKSKLSLFGQKINDGYDNCAVVRFFRFTICENGTKKLRLIPCYRKSDGEIGLYDIVNNIFYTNEGSGVFLKGADI